jgi:uncharacterized protein
MSGRKFLIAITLLVIITSACRNESQPAYQPAPTRTIPAPAAKNSTALVPAAVAGDITKVKGLLAEGVDPNTKGTGNTTPLIEAAYAGHTEIVRALMEKGANVSLKKDDGETAYSFAASRKHDDIAKMIDQVNQLLVAAGKGDNAAVKQLLEQGAIVNARGESGRTALMEAAYGGHTEIIKMLLDKGADVTSKKDDGATALSLAQGPKKNEIAELLKQKGAQ